MTTVDKEIVRVLEAQLDLALAALRYAVDVEGDGMYLTCADTPYCPKGKAAEHGPECMVRRAHDALAEIEAMP